MRDPSKAVVELARTARPHPVQADRASDLGKARVVEVGAVDGDAVRLHLELDERERAVVEDNHLDRQMLLAKREKFTHQHRETTIAGKRHHLASGTEPVRRSPEAARSPSSRGLNEPEQPPPAVHRQIARGPDRWVPTSTVKIASSAATLSIAAATSCGWMGRWSGGRSPARRAARAFGDSGLALLEVLGVALFGQVRHQRLDGVRRCRPAARPPDAAADVLAANVDLDNRALSGKNGR